MRAVIAALLGVAALAAPAFAEDRALVIGVNAYSPDDQVNPLAGSVNDAEAMRALLTGPLGFRDDQVLMLLDGDATRAGILAALDSWIEAGTGPGDRVWITFSGHGSNVPDQDGDEADGLDEVILPVDAALGADGRLQNAILDDEIAAHLRRLPGRQVTLLFDSCYSGTMSRSIVASGTFSALGGERAPVDAPPAPQALAAVAENQDERPLEDLEAEEAVVWTAASNLQMAQEDRVGRPQGVFTASFVEGIESGAADLNRNGIVSHAELLAFVRARSAAFCRDATHLCRTPLTPTLEGPADIWARDVASRAEAADLGDRIADLFVPEEPWPVSLAGPATLHVGDVVHLAVESDRAGWLTLIDVRPDGGMVLIYPNRDVAGSGLALAAGRRIGVPEVLPPQRDRFRLVAGDPPGAGVILALVTADPVDVGALIDRAAIAAAGPGSRALIAVPDAEPTLDRLVLALSRAWTAEAESRSVAWSAAILPYLVAP